MIDIRLPNINASTESGQLQQIRTYLYQFAEQLNWALNTLETNPGGGNVVVQTAAGSNVANTEGAKAQETFNSIKNLIIKSADIVEAYYEEIDNLISLNGKYAAQADFGEGGVAKYIENTNMSISATSQYVDQKFQRTETIDGAEVVTGEYKLADIDKRIRKQEGSIRYGNVKTTLTEDGNTIGIEVGEIDTVNDVATSRFATFSAAGIELYDGTTNTPPVAIISKWMITITNAKFTGNVWLGKYRVDTSNGVAFKWEGV